VSGAPAVSFIGSPEGREVLVYGTAPGEVRLEVRMGDALVSTFRALVDSGPAGPLPVQHPERHDARRPPPVDARRRAVAHPHGQLLPAPAGHRAGPGRHPAVTHHAVASAIPGIFTINVANGVTRNTAGNAAVVRNRRAGVMNFAYIKSDAGGNLGVGMFFPASGAPGNTFTDNGTPSTSWIVPSGVAPDGAAGAVVMRLIPAIPHPTIANFAAMYVTDTNGNPAVPAAAATYAGTIAHEVCHLFNLNHRVDTPASPFNDGSQLPAG
jgi:hypothetical protein